LLLAAAACGGGRTDVKGAPCEGLAKPADPAASLPPGVPAGIEGATFYETQKQGVTTRYFAHVAGTDVVAVRDAIERAYASSGAAIEGRDAEPPAEAEFQWTSGDREGSVQVTPLCDGRVQLRYRVAPR
jgi:hypothetical protein